MVDPHALAQSGTTVRTERDDAPPRGLGIGLGVTVLAVGVAVAFGSITGAPAQVATDVVTAQAQPPAAGAPPTTPSGRPLATAFGVAFPDLASRLGWQPVGRRDDVVDGRAVRTVVYARAGRRLAWSVIDGAPVPVPPGATSVPVRGPGTAQFESGGRVAVLTTRGGHSVVVSAAGVSPVAIVRAARAQ